MAKMNDRVRADACLQFLSEGKHSVWLQKMSETTYVADVADFSCDKSTMPPETWRGRFYRGKWHYGTYIEVLLKLVREAQK